MALAINSSLRSQVNRVAHALALTFEVKKKAELLARLEEMAKAGATQKQMETYLTEIGEFK